MKNDPIQFDAREITASSGPHDSRIATDVHSKLSQTHNLDPSTRIFPHDNESQAIDAESQLHAASQRAATGERDANQLLTIRDVAEMLQVPVSWVYGRMRKRSRERLPGYRLGKYWRFREQELMEWVQCHRGGSHAT